MANLRCAKTCQTYFLIKFVQIHGKHEHDKLAMVTKDVKKHGKLRCSNPWQTCHGN